MGRFIPRFIGTNLPRSMGINLPILIGRFLPIIMDNTARSWPYFYLDFYL